MVRVPSVVDVQRTQIARDPGLREAPAGGLGDALLGVAEFVGDEADRQLFKEQKAREAEDLLALTRFEDDVSRLGTETEIESRRNAEARPHGFADRTTEDFSKAVDERVEALPERLRPAAKMFREETVGRFRDRQLVFENNAVVSSLTRDFEDQLGQLSIDASRAPEDVEEILASIDERGRIARESLGVPADKVREEVDKAKRNVAIAALRAVAPAERIEMVDDGAFDEELGDAKTIAALKAEAERELRQERAIAVNGIVAQSDDHFASIRATGVGITGLRDRAAVVLEPEDFEEFVAKEGRAEQAFGAREEMKFGPPGRIAEIVAGFEPTPGSDDFADELALFQDVQQDAIQITKARAEDPAAFVMGIEPVRESVTAAQQLAAAADEEERPAATTVFQQALRTRLAMQTEIGVPEVSRRVLTKAEASGITAQIMSADAEEKAGAILGLQQTYGSFFPRVMQELDAAGLDRKHQALAVVAGDPVVAPRLAEVIRVGGSELAKGLDRTQVTTTRTTVTTLLAEWAGAVDAGDPTGARAPQINETVAVIQDLAVANLRSGLSPQEAADQAARQVILDRFVVEAGMWMPRFVGSEPINPAKVLALTEMRQRREDIEAFGPVPFEGGDSPSPVDLERTLATAANSGFWVTNETGTGAFLMVPFRGGGALPLLDAEGRRYEIDFLQASQDPDIRPGSGVAGIESADPETRRRNLERLNEPFEELRERARRLTEEPQQ